MRFNPFSRPPRRGRPREYTSWLKPETKQAVIGVLVLLCACIIGLSFIGQAGRVGTVLVQLTRQGFGWLAYPVPLVLAYAGYRLLRPRAEPLERWRLVGVALLGLGLLGAAHVVGVSPEAALQGASEGRGGGYVGFMLSYPVSLAISPVIAALIFVAATVIGLFMTFNLSPADVYDWLKGLLPRRLSDTEVNDELDEEAGDDTADTVSSTIPRFSIRRMTRASEPDPDQLKLEEQKNKEHQQAELRRKQVKAANKRYTPPPIELLASSTRQPEGGDVEANKQSIEETLRNFNITVTMGKARVGPTVTQYTLRPDEGIRLSQITALQNDLARALKAHPVRIEAPIPNTDLVGIEIPNKKVALVRLRDLLTAKEMRRSESPLTIVLGKDVAGVAVTTEIDRMPHLLIAGATNSGKSVCIHSILMSLIYRNSPALLRLIMIDPKRVELAGYNGIPHLWGQPVIVDTNKALNAFKWALREMDRRYKLLEESGSRNLFSYNINNPAETLPFIVIVIDELADLMAKHAREVEGPIVRLSQLARAVGIHLILATQRPSVNVITGLIKANVPVRIAFKVASQIDSRTILDMAGAEKLVGTGDMLYLGSDNSKPRRLQGGFVSEDEVREVVKFIVDHNPTDEFIAAAEPESITAPELSSRSSSREENDDPLFGEAKQLAIEAGKVSASLLQRRLRIGYARAARLLDILEEQGVISHAEGNKPREILVAEGSERTSDDEGDEPDRTYEQLEEPSDDPPAEEKAW